jgi:hypothetical protein
VVIKPEKLEFVQKALALHVSSIHRQEVFRASPSQALTRLHLPLFEPNKLEQNTYTKLTEDTKKRGTGKGRSRGGGGGGGGGVVGDDTYGEEWDEYAEDQ